MKKIQISESRLRNIIREELISERIFSNIQSVTGMIRDPDIKKLNTALYTAIRSIGNIRRKQEIEVSRRAGWYDAAERGDKEYSNVIRTLWKNIKKANTIEKLNQQFDYLFRELSIGRDSQTINLLKNAITSTNLEKWIEFANTL